LILEPSKVAVRKRHSMAGWSPPTLYVFCGRHLLVAKLRSAAMDAAAGAIEEMARVVAHIRRRWPCVRILLRADSGFAREDLIAWCEANGVDFLFGLAKNERLIAEIETELDVVAAKSRRTGRMERRFKRTRTDIWPLVSAVAAMALAVPPVTDPPQENPMIRVATTPKAIPCSRRARDSPCRIDGISRAFAFQCERADGS
jgi:hypothetical protein